MKETTVKDFKAWLDRFPDETIVFFGFQQPASPYQSYGPVDFKSPELKDDDAGDGWDFTDWSKNRFVDPSDSHYNQKHLELGEAD